MSEIRGRDVALLWGGTAVDNLQSWSFSGNTGEIGSTSFDSNDWEDFVTGTKSGSVTMSANVDSDDTENFDEAAADWIAGTRQAWVLGPTTSGATTLGGNGTIMDFSYEGDLDSMVTYSVTIKNSGTITQGTVA